MALPLSVFFYSAFVTSVWIWLYVLAWVFVRTVLTVGTGVSWLLRATDVERQPFRSMGYTTIVFVTAIMLLALPLLGLL